MGGDIGTENSALRSWEGKIEILTTVLSETDYSINVYTIFVYDLFVNVLAQTNENSRR